MEYTHSRTYKCLDCGGDVDENLDGSWECIGCEFITRAEPTHLVGKDVQVEDIWAIGLRGYYEND